MTAVVMTFLSGVFGLGLGDTFCIIALQSVGVARAVPLVATYPLFSLVWSTFLLGEPLTLTAVLGACVILFGIWLLSKDKNEETGVRGKLPLTGAIVSLATVMVWLVSVTLMGSP
jgi:drug/metabolite transporter (DMT)-like permease